MIKEHLNLKYKEKVKITGTQSFFDGVEVVVKGIAQRNIVDYYIVEFADGKTKTSIEQHGQEPVEYSCLVMPEFYLER